ncbi:MAG: aminotransferase class I/II-fold pyridoxal phosphate-dependent enzyme, partial [Candidatus Krumholzibacteria bacterium]|nr:aminotransferase class I/II-fold pyridoxal phosphate-dependent enzyme [Candidatus Krumholzibacteria bacterium]
YGIMPPVLADQISKIQTNSNSCTASFTQMAGAEAITGPQDESLKMMAEFKARRDLIVDGLNKIEGFKCLKPKGAFYVFPNITGTGKKSKEIEEYLLDKAGVAGLSGTSFGEHGEGYLRFSYANSQENLKKALAKIEEAL